jgi:uncharacterized protein YndB with AHSA1/START domain
MPTVQREITVPAEPEEVWEALTDEALREAWLHDDADPRSIREEEAAEDGRELRFEWARPGQPATSVRFTLEPVPAGTRVVVVESGPSAAAWGPRLGALAAHVPAFA